MNRKALVGIGIAVPAVLIIGILIFLAQNSLLPGQPQPTRIAANVTPFAGTGSSSTAGATTAPTTAAAASTIVTPAPATTRPAGSAPSGTTTASASSVAGGAVGTIPAGANAYIIVADKSQAKATVNEKLVRLPTRSDAVLTTNAMRGQIVLGADGKPTTASTFEVDLRTLKSDTSQRDNYVQKNTLQTNQFPTATFVITGVEGWQQMKDGQQTTFKLVGNMTIHGVTKPLTFDTTAMMQGNTLNGTAVTQFKFQDFGMQNPNIANIVSTDDTIKLEMTIGAQKG